MAVLCYLGAIRVPVVALIVPDWVFTVPTGLLVAGGIWLYSRRRSAFCYHHARAGLTWAVQTNGLLLLIALAAKLLYALWFRTGIPLLNQTWHLAADLFRWTGILVALLTLLVMLRAARGQTGDPLGLPQ